MEALTDEERAAVMQLRDLTNGGDDDVAISMLQSVDWDVQKAADMIFGTAHDSNPPPRARSETPALEPFDGIDDSLPDDSLLGRPRQTHNARNPIMSIITYPFQLLSSIIRFVFNILRIPLPYIPFLSRNFQFPRPAPRRSGGPERWIRELEEETGAICIGKAGTGVSSGVGVGLGEAGPSRRVASTSDLDGGRKYLPDFALGTYDQFLKVLSKETRIGCVILVSEEHDDVPEFKRSTLTDPTFVNLLTDNNIYTWGGDVRDTPAFTASLKLQSTTYPYVAFIALQPTRSRHSTDSNTAPTLSILSRHQGAAATTAEALCTHLVETLLPRVQPYLARIKNAQNAREAERELRAQQDRAFEESARRDRDRILQKMREEEESKRLAEEEAEAEARRQEQKERERLDVEKRKRKRMGARIWLRDHPDGFTGGEGELRVAVRMPSGARVVRKFRRTDTLSTLYAFVDTQFIPDGTVAKESSSSSADNVDNTVQEFMDVAGEGDGWWEFKLASTYPRKEIGWRKNVRLGDVPELAAGGQIVVEMISATENEDDGDGDGYKTESDEE